MDDADENAEKHDVETRSLKMFLAIMKNKIMRRRLFIASFTWYYKFSSFQYIFASGNRSNYSLRLTINLVYYAIALNSSSLSGDRYLNCFASAVVEIPCILIGYYAGEKIGRVRTLATAFLLSGLLCGLVPIFQICELLVIPYIYTLVFMQLNTLLFHIKGSELALTALAILGKGAIAACFYVVYLHTAEICPTASRNIFLSFCSAVARIGAFVSPYVMFLGEYGDKHIVR